MQKRYLILLVMILSVSMMSLIAQDEEETFRVWSPIEGITAGWVEVTDEEGNDTLALELTVIGMHPDGCESEIITEQSRYEFNLDIQLYREISQIAVCPQVETPFQIKVVLDSSPSDMTPYIIVNDQVWQVTLPEGDSITSDDLPTLEELTLVGAVIDDVTATFIDGEEAVYALAVQGSYGVGCDLPLVQRVREVQDYVLIGLYSPVPELAVCPAMLIILDETIEIPATLVTDDTLVAVNELIINQLETQTMSDSIKVMTNINSVTVNVMESDPAQISLDITGEHPDGCQLPVVVNQSRSGNSVTVEIYREVPADMMCPMMLNPYEATVKLDGTFATGGYTITVNEVSRSVDI